MWTVMLMPLVACKQTNPDIRGTGHFEADEILVSAEVNGKVLAWNAHEGKQVQQGEVLGQLDTLQLVLQRQALQAQSQSVRAASPNIKVQTAALEAKLNQLQRERSRTQKLVAAGAATQKQLDDLESAIAQAESQLKAQSSALQQSNSQIGAQGNALDTQGEQLTDLIARSTLRAPITGTILECYIKQGEMAGQGRPLYSIANLKEMTLRAYVSNSEMSQLQIGQQVQVFVDAGSNEMKAYQGKVVWVAEKSEFTPKTVQTKDERSNQVYAIKVRVPNDGFIKIGMYGEVHRAPKQ